MTCTGFHRQSIAFLAVLIVGAMTAPCFAQEVDISKIRSISVTGSVEKKVAPDHIVWHISIVDTDRDLSTAKTRNDEKIQRIVALRESLGIAEGDFESGSISIRRETDSPGGGRRGSFLHYEVRRSVTIRQRDLGRFDEYLDALVDRSDMEVSFSYAVSNVHELRAEARLDALRAARAKAQAMAEAVGAELGPVLTIDEHSTRDRWQGGSVFANTASVVSSPDADLASDRFVPGAVRITMSVWTTFALK